MDAVGLTAATTGALTRRHILGALAAWPLLAMPRSAAAGDATGAATAAAPLPTRIVVVGDSQAQGLAAGLQRLYRQDARFRVLDHARISTGLLRLGFFDWPAHAQQIAPSLRATTAVVMFGANDRPSVRVRGEVDPQLLQNFSSLYGARARTIIRAFRAAGTHVVWVGHPVVRGQAYAEDMAIINQVCTQACVAEGADFVPLWNLFTDQSGQYIAYGPGPDGQTTRLRSDDGVHLTMAGYILAAQQIRPLVTAASPTPDLASSRLATSRLAASRLATSHLAGLASR